jgi:hypothetical protein
MPFVPFALVEADALVATDALVETNAFVETDRLHKTLPVLAVSSNR